MALQTRSEFAFELGDGVDLSYSFKSTFKRVYEHDFRRTAVRNLERAGVPRSVAMKLTGHKTESVYRRYAIADDRDLRVAVERLDNSAVG